MLRVLSLPVVLGAEAVRWVADCGSSLGSLFGPSIEDMSELHTKQEAVSELITLAVLADGEVTDEEATNLRHLFETSEQFTGDPDEAIAHLRECARRASEIESLENTVRVLGSDLDRDWKDDAFRFVAMLALRGSGFGRSEQGFRVAPASDPGSLLAVFARGLDVSDDVRDAALSAAGT